MDKLNILIVDDEPIIAEILADSLCDKFNIKIATNGQRGYEAFKAISPNIVIADINMPEVNGLEMIKRIRKLDQNVKIIVMTSHQDTSYLMEAIELKLTKYLLKPIDQKELLEAVDIAVNELSKFYTIPRDMIKVDDNHTWDIENSNLLKNGVPIKLTAKERKILSYLFHNLNRVISYEEIIINVWDRYYEGQSKDALKTRLSTMRKKLPEGLIQNIFGVGYSINL